MKKYRLKNVGIIVLIILVIVLSIGYVGLFKSNKCGKKLAKGTEIDLIIFMGQSNMSGTGDAKQAPTVIDGAGYEFRAISDPTKLYKIQEPFGELESKEGGINDVDLKCGSMVSSFVNSYYSITKTPIVAVSASVGGSSLHSWEPEGELLTDAEERFNLAVQWLTDNGYTIRHKYMVWLQGESDGNKGTSEDEYIKGLKSIVDSMQENGVENCFLIRIGENTDDFQLHDVIIQAQTKLCSTDLDFILVSTKSVELYKLGLMRDFVHYNQGGLNIIGEEAGANAAYYVVNGVEPSMYDSYFDNLYVGSKR